MINSLPLPSTKLNTHFKQLQCWTCKSFEMWCFVIGPAVKNALKHCSAFIFRMDQSQKIWTSSNTAVTSNLSFHEITLTKAPYFPHTMWGSHITNSTVDHTSLVTQCPYKFSQNNVTWSNTFQTRTKRNMRANMYTEQHTDINTPKFFFLLKYGK